MGETGHVAMTIARGIRCAATANPGKTAIVDADSAASRSYAELVERITRIGALAAERRLKKGDVVALVAPNCIDYIEIVAGLSERGIIVATLNPGLSVDELEQIFRDCSPRLVIAAEPVSLPPSAPDALRLGSEFEQALAAAPPLPPSPMVDERESFALAYTSGTTGRPKGVLLSHRSRCLLFGAMATEYGCFGRDDHFLALAPMAHGAGLAFAIAPIFHGGRCTLLHSSAPEALLEALATYEPNGIFVVPTHLHRLFGAEPELLDRYRGRHRLRTIISNAAALSPALKEAAVEYFGEGLLHETYGSTEGGIVTNIRPIDLLGKPRSVGTAFLNMEIELRRPDRSIADPGEPGELFCRSPYSFNGYLNRPEETSAALVEGWVTVGDLAVRDEDGFITITDRKKDMVVTGGMNVYPREIENAIEQVPGVSECAVVGRPDEEWGESLHAFVVTSANSTVLADEVLAACRSNLAPYKVPKKVSFLSELPRNASGKIVKRSLLDAEDS